MKKNTLVLLTMAAVLTACNSYTEMTLPADTTLPQASEYVLDKEYSEAKVWLEKHGYTYTGEDDYSRKFERGERDTLFDNGGAGVEEAIWLGVDEKTNIVGYVSGVRSFRNITDALNVYEKWSNYTWKNILPDPLVWHGTIFFNEEKTLNTDVTYNIKYQDYTDGTFEREEGFEYAPNRKEFEKQLKQKENIRDTNESYERSSQPKEIQLLLQNIDKKFYTIEFENHDFIVQWE